jgi:hypothetical protein
MPLVLAVEPGVLLGSKGPRAVQAGWTGWVKREALRASPFLRRLYGKPPDAGDDEIVVLEDDAS